MEVKKGIIISSIMPNNERVKKKLEVERQLEEKQRLENEKKKKLQEEFTLEEMIKKQQQEDDKMKKIQEEENLEQDTKFRYIAIQKMEGNLIEIIRQILNNTSPHALSFAGLDLDTWNFTNLMLFLPENKSLLTLDLSRKNLTDYNAKQIADMLKTNKKLVRLELEGNFFGPEGCKFLAEALRINKTLKYLDLENNKLTNQGEDDSGIISLFKSLRVNKTLISLNLNNNYLTAICGHAICECLRENENLIHLDVMQNQRFTSKKNERNEDGDSKYASNGLNLFQLEEIKEKIAENKKLYDTMRKEEWKERKNMKVDDDEVNNVATYLSHLKQEVSMKEEDKNFIENYYMMKFNDECKRIESDFYNNVEGYYAETKAKNEKKTKPKGKPKK